MMIPVTITYYLESVATLCVYQKVHVDFLTFLTSIYIKCDYPTPLISGIMNLEQQGTKL